jgi:acyl-coenzyme A thioesterase PaaI-like protein
MAETPEFTSGHPGRIQQPGSRNCFVCGVENPHGLHMIFYETGPGEVVCEYVVPEAYEGYPGVVHGGIIASMLDEIASRAAMKGDSSQFCVTARLTIHYRKLVPTGKKIRINSHLQSKRGRVAMITAELRLPDGSIGAEAEAVMVDLPQVEADRESSEELDWKISPNDARARP